MSKHKVTPRIVIIKAAALRYGSRAEAWEIIGPALARILATAIGQDKEHSQAQPR